MKQKPFSRGNANEMAKRNAFSPKKVILIQTFRERCTQITYQECREEARPVQCQDSTLRVPYQPKIHRVKCLLADDDDNPDLDI